MKIDVDDTGRVNVASSDADGLAQAIQMISDITAVPEIGKTYLGKVVRLAEFGAFVEIFPGTDGLLHVSEIAEHRVAQVKDELREGDQILVKVLSIEGNRIKLSRKAVLREQRAKLGLDEPGQGAPPPVQEFDDDGGGDDGEVLLEGGAEFDDNDSDDAPDAEPNFNRADPVPAHAGPGGGGDRRPGGGGGCGGRGTGGPGGPGGGGRPGGRRRRGGGGGGGRGPRGGGGGRGPGGGSGGGNR